MPIDFSKFADYWIFSSESVGDWKVRPYSINAMIEIEKFLKSKEEDSTEGVKSLMRVVCKRHSDLEADSINEKMKQSEIDNLSQSDIQNFAVEFLEHNKNRFEDSGVLPLKTENQSDSEFLMMVLAAENKRQTESLKNSFASLQSRLKDITKYESTGLRNLAQGLLKQNENMEKVYGSKHSSFSLPLSNIEPPQIAENPVHRTNDHLADMNGRLNNLVEFGEEAIQRMHGLEVAAAEFLGKFSHEAGENSKAAKKAILVGVLAVILSTLQILYTEFIRVPQDSAAMGAALTSVRGDLNQLRMVLSENLTISKTVKESATETIANALSAAGDRNTALLEGIDQLLRQQQERDEAIIEALEAIAQTQN